MRMNISSPVNGGRYSKDIVGRDYCRLDRRILSKKCEVGLSCLSTQRQTELWVTTWVWEMSYGDPPSDTRDS